MNMAKKLKELIGMSLARSLIQIELYEAHTKFIIELAQHFLILFESFEAMTA